MLHELRLLRAEHNLCTLARALPRGARCIRVAYTLHELVCLYRL